MPIINSINPNQTPFPWERAGDRITSEYPHTKTGNSGGIGTSIKNLAVGLLAQGGMLSLTSTKYQYNNYV